MTDVDDRRTSPIRHGQPWTEHDFADVMQAIREDCTLEEISERVGRSVNGLRNQLRRMLPGDERHLAADAVLLRIRQLNRDGDYDWLAAMAEQPKPEWQKLREAEQHSRQTLLENARVVGVGALPDDHLMALAAAVLDSRDPLPAELGEAMSKEITERGLQGRLADRGRDRVDGSLAALLGTEPPPRWDREDHDERYGGWDVDSRRYGGPYEAWGDEPHRAGGLDRYSGELGPRGF